jgi:hypothetical protein
MKNKEEWIKLTGAQESFYQTIDKKRTARMWTNWGSGVCEEL